MFAVDEVATRPIAAYDAAGTVAPITDEAPDFDVAAAYAVLFEIERRRREQGWVPAGRKIGLTISYWTARRWRSRTWSGSWPASGSSQGSLRARS